MSNGVVFNAACFKHHRSTTQPSTRFDGLGDKKKHRCHQGSDEGHANTAPVRRSNEKPDDDATAKGNPKMAAPRCEPTITRRHLFQMYTHAMLQQRY
jgi:hypothetical protein